MANVYSQSKTKMSFAVAAIPAVKSPFDAGINRISISAEPLTPTVAAPLIPAPAPAEIPGVTLTVPVKESFGFSKSFRIPPFTAAFRFPPSST